MNFNFWHLRFEYQLQGYSSDVFHILKSTIRQNVFPLLTKSHKCTVLLFLNLAEPEWISVNCTQAVLFDVLCFLQRAQNNSAEFHSDLFAKNQAICMSSSIAINGMCYRFVWHKKENKNIIGKRHFELTASLAQIKEREIFEVLFVAINSKFPALLFPLQSDVKFVEIFTYITHLNTFAYHSFVALVSEAHGFFLRTSGTSDPDVGDHMFKCQTGAYISSLHFCDQTADCPNNDTSDEQFCGCQSDAEPDCTQYICTEELHANEESKFSLLYYFSSNGRLHRYILSPEQVYTFEEGRNFTCENNVSLDSALVDDLISDCGSDAEDEQQLVLLLKTILMFSCISPNEIACKEGHSKCFNISDICVYKLNRFHHSVPCRNGGHLLNCQKFECNVHFKCPDSYCVSWLYVCDGKWDCPHGKEENCGFASPCLDMFKCKNARCIHLGSVCDGSQDCPADDDELLCFLKSWVCPRDCHCVAMAIKCYNTNFVCLTSCPHMALFLYGSEIANLEGFVKNLVHLVYLSLVHGNLTQACGTILPINLLSCDLGFNSVQQLQKNCFLSANNLKTLLIDNNKISCLESRTFGNLPQLMLLQLSNNPLSHLPSCLSVSTRNLKFLSMQHVKFSLVSRKAFQSVTLAVVSTTDFLLCCIEPSPSVCTAASVWYNSCLELLPDKQSKLAYTLISALSFMLNLASILLHLHYTNKTNKSFSLTVSFISACHVLFTSYLSIIWITDKKYQDDPYTQSSSWKSGLLCFTALSVFLCFNISTQVENLLLSVCRFMIVISPFDTVFKRTTFVKKVNALCLLTSCSISVGATFVLKVINKELPFNLCLPVVDPTHSNVFMQAITWFIAVSQLITATTISVIHPWLIIEKRKSERNTGKLHSDRSLIAQLFALTLSNFVCWVPANAVFVSVMFLSQYPVDLIIWTVVGISSTNPLLIPTILIIVLLKQNLR